MGFSPQQVDAMSLWQFRAAIGGYVKANSSEDTLDEPTAEDLELLDADIAAVMAMSAEVVQLDAYRSSSHG